jgi:hypothetical protein
LTAISSKSYERLEILCEDELTEAIAACIYDQSVIQENQFQIHKPAKNEVYDIRVLNHFFLHNVQVTRSLNDHLLMSNHILEE